MRNCEAQLLFRLHTSTTHAHFQLYFFLTDASKASIVTTNCTLNWTTANITRSTYWKLAQYFPGAVVSGAPLAKSEVGMVRMLCLCYQCTSNI